VPDPGCFVLAIESGLAGDPLVWPYGTEPSAGDKPGVVLPDGQLVEVGDQVVGAGTYLLPQGDDETYGVPEECRVYNERQIAVFTADSSIEVEPSGG
jgi:hypothetical protein